MDIGLVGGAIFVAGTLIAGHYAYQWGKSKSLEMREIYKS